LLLLKAFNFFLLLLFTPNLYCFILKLGFIYQFHIKYQFKKHSIQKIPQSLTLSLPFLNYISTLKKRKKEKCTFFQRLHVYLFLNSSSYNKPFNYIIRIYDSQSHKEDLVPCSFNFAQLGCQQVSCRLFAMVLTANRETRCTSLMAFICFIHVYIY